MSQFPPSGDPNPYAAPPVKGQPMPPGSVKNWLVESIIALICCGGIFAIPAIVYAAQVNGKLQAGDYAGAVEASNNAKKWLIIAICIGVTCIGLSILINILGAIASQA